MKLENTIYNQLREFVKEHHGFSGKDFDEHPEIDKKYNAFMAELKKLDGKRVKINFLYVADFTRIEDCKTGRIRVDKDRVKFYEGKKRVKYYNLDAGLFEGWYATLIPITIETI